jgi:hypothetical protein
VNAAFVEEIQPLSTGEYMLRVTGGKKYTVTRTYKKNLHLLAESWIGTDGFVQMERDCSRATEIPGETDGRRPSLP